MKVKTASLAHFKALDDAGEPEGTFEAIVSVFGNVDYVGDRVVEGAFAKSLATWAASGDPIPVIWSHQWQDPLMHIGGVLEAEERAGGLWVKAQLDIAGDPVAAKVWRLLASRRVREFSFAYDVIDEKQQNGANELLEIDVIEVGPTLKGMNPDTALLDAKARRAARAAIAKTGEDDDQTETAGADVADEQEGAEVDQDSPDEQSDVIEEHSDDDSDPAGGGGEKNAAPSARTGRKAMVTLDGSYEQLQQRLAAAIGDWAGAAFAGLDIYLAGLEATYPDHAVVYVETWSQPWGGGDYHSATYEVDTAGVASLGDPAPIQLLGVAVPKACTELAGGKKTARPAEPFAAPASVRAQAELLELGG